MKAADVFPGKWLKAADLGTSTPTVTIERVEMEKMPDDGEMKPVVYFVGKERGIVLNKTNFNTIEELSGEPDTNDWKGTRIKLIVVKVEYQGKRVPAIRIEEPAPAGKPAAKQAAPKRTPNALPPPVVEEEGPDFDATDAPDEDEIPF